MVCTLAIMLVLCSTQSSFARTELAYDDGTAEASGMPDLPPIGTGYGAVLFSLPSGWSTARLVTFRFYKCADEACGNVAVKSATPVEIHILSNNGVTELTTPFQLDITIDNSWNIFDLTSRSIIVPKDFYVAVKWLQQGPLIGFDADGPIAHRTFGQTCDS